MHYTYTPKGVCSRKLELDIEDGIIRSCSFVGGCNGNTKGLSALVEGQPVEEVIQRLSGITCGMRGTSCPDQLSKALKEAIEA